MLEFIQSFGDIPVSIFVLLFFAGLFGSVMNAFAGGGAFLVFPVLLWAGLAPITANATCKCAFFPGYFGSILALRQYFIHSPKIILAILMIAPIGGTIGALLTLNLGNETFKLFIPWLLLGNTFLIWRGEYLTNLLQRYANSYIETFIHILSIILLVLTSIYGGFFGAGLGILLIVALSLYCKADTDLNSINAVKIVMSIFINSAAVAMYIWWGVINWQMAFVQMLGGVVGGYAGGRIGASLNQTLLRNVIALMGVVLSVIYFYEYGYFS